MDESDKSSDLGDEASEQEEEESEESSDEGIVLPTNAEHRSITGTATSEVYW
jgi:hypothetical protein